MTPSEAHDLAIALAPELSGKLAVIRHTDDLGPSPDSRLAWCCAGRHLGIRDELRRLGLWRGFWPSTVIFVAEPSIEVLIHELGHVLPARSVIVDDGDEPTPEQRDYQTAQLTRWASRVDEAGRVPWHGHDVRFVRRVAHLLRRAEQLGHDVSYNALNVASDRYGLSHVHSYLERFAHEPAMSVHRTFDEIDQLPFPDPVLRLFADDVRIWAITELIGDRHA